MAEKAEIIPYNAIATIRKLRFNRKPIRSRHDRSKWHKQKGINRHNLQDIFISEDIIMKPSTQCKIGTINAHSIKNKDTFLAQEISTNNLDLTLLTETWLNGIPQDTAWLYHSDLIQSGYAISMLNRPSRGGGIALLYKYSMKVKKIEGQHLHTIEYAIWLVSLKNKTIEILGIYHPPPKQDQTNTIFLDEITELLTSKLPNTENTIILGHFNMHTEDPNNNNSKLFVETVEALGLKQHVVEPTHQKGNILDLIFTEVTSQINVRQLEMPDFISDHQLISATIDVKEDALKITRKKIRNFKEVIPATLRENFHPAHLNQNTNTNESHNQLNLQLQEMLDKCVPAKIVKRPKKNTKPMVQSYLM